MTTRDLQILGDDGRIYRVGDIVEGAFSVGDARALSSGPQRIVQREDGRIGLEPVVYVFSGEVARPPQPKRHQGLNRAQRRKLRLSPPSPPRSG